MNLLNNIMVGLLVVGLLAIFVLYSMEKLTTDGFINSIFGLILATIVLSKIINRPTKNSK